MPALAITSLDEFAFRLLNWESEGWLVLVVSAALAPGDGAVRIADLVRALADMSVDLFQVTSADSLIHDIQRGRRGPRAPIVSWGYERFHAEQWRHLDLARSALASDHAVAMVMAMESFGLMQVEAPNLASWLGGAWEGVGILPLTEQERSARLTRLRQRYKKSDAEVIALARSAQGSVDPDFIEWLILLGRDGVLKES